MDLLKIMGLEALYEKNTWDALHENISQNTRYIIPGYMYNYRLRSFPGYIEFHRCEMPDGTIVKTDMHFSADSFWEFEVRALAKEDVSAPFYWLEGDDGNTVPVRIICPDVLPSIEPGDILYGQIVAFADCVSLAAPLSSVRKAVAAEGEYATVNGCVERAAKGHFVFQNVESSFWEIDIDTENGQLTVVVAENNINFTPVEGCVISVHGILSMDIATDIAERENVVFSEPEYEEILEEADAVYRHGFLVDFHRNQRVIISSILKGELSRILRCCKESVEFASSIEGKKIVWIRDREGILDELKYALPENVSDVEVNHILTCETESRIGHDGIVVSSAKGVELVIWFDIDENGFICRMEFFSPDKCTVGIDHELHLYAMFAYALCNNKSFLLYEYLTPGCMYRSEYADACRVGSRNIIERFADIDSNLDESTKYTFEFARIKDELCRSENLPPMYRGKYCTVQYQSGKVAYVALIEMTEEHKISNILISRNGSYLKRFAQTEQPKVSQAKSVREVLYTVYGIDATIETMRERELPTDDRQGVYVWKKADEFATEWFEEYGYKVSGSSVMEDCIAYTCHRRGTDYAVFFYAYGEEPMPPMDGDYCAKLREEDISYGREVLILCIRVTCEVDENGAVKYAIESCYGEDRDIEPWRLITVNGRNILQYYPRKELVDLNLSLIAAYNGRNLDAMKALFAQDIVLEDYERDGQFMNDGFYSALSYRREQCGEMKLAYIRKGKFCFSAVPYIENRAFISFVVGKKIEKLLWHSLGEEYCELLIAENTELACIADEPPLLSSVEFLEPSDISRFSMRLTFANGEIKRYDIPGEWNDEIIRFQGYIMTDKIFRNGRILEHISLPFWRGYHNYAQRGQGVEFVTGAAISTAELYNDSYPIEKFSYADMEQVHVDYDEEGYGFGTIPDMDPANPYYLFDKNTMTATVLPGEYQDTPIYIYPSCGGYSEGLIMVSKMGKLNLHYHHDRSACAGLWGWLDRDMNVVIQPKYVYAMNFANGRAIVCKGKWDVTTAEDGEKRYWCNNEQWGVIDQQEREVIPCRFDEIYEVDNTDRLYIVHEGGWEEGHYSIYDVQEQKIILELDFDFDMGYMFNGCFVADGDILVFMNHIPGEGEDLLYVYDLCNKKYIAYAESYTERTFNGESKVVVNKDGKEIIIF